MAHRARPVHKSRHPTHLTLRALRRAPSLRGQRTFAIIQEVIEELGRDAAEAGAGFRVTHYSVQHDHVHLIVEANDGDELSSGARKLVIRIVRRFQERLGWRGPLWGDRYHRRDLTTPSEVRNCLVYLLQNVKKHAGLDRDVAMTDPCSSGPWFEGWAGPLPRPVRAEPPVAKPRTWLLTTGWMRLGLLRFEEAPAARRGHPRGSIRWRR